MYLLDRLFLNFLLYSNNISWHFKILLVKYLIVNLLISIIFLINKDCISKADEY